MAQQHNGTMCLQRTSQGPLSLCARSYSTVKPPPKLKRVMSISDSRQSLRQAALVYLCTEFACRGQLFEWMDNTWAPLPMLAEPDYLIVVNLVRLLSDSEGGVVTRRECRNYVYQILPEGFIKLFAHCGEDGALLHISANHIALRFNVDASDLTDYVSALRLMYQIDGGR